ncbi:MAG: hypothetical protein V3S93_03075, partial [Methyloceanibacter sp.]
RNNWPETAKALTGIDMPRKIIVRACACGCGTLTRGAGTYAPGHDQKLRIAIENHIGGLQQLRDAVEKLTRRSVDVGA